MTRWTEEDLANHVRRHHRPMGARVEQDSASVPTPKKSKFKNIRCQSADGKNFASRLERDYYEQLLLRWRAGEVLWFIRQPRFDLEGGVVYVADFLVVTRAGVVLIDTKGHQTQDSKNKLKQVKARYGIDVQIIRNGGF